jgi:hypothetical protein
VEPPEIAALASRIASCGRAVDSSIEGLAGRLDRLRARARSGAVDPRFALLGVALGAQRREIESLGAELNRVSAAAAAARRRGPPQGAAPAPGRPRAIASPAASPAVREQIAAIQNCQRELFEGRLEISRAVLGLAGRVELCLASADAVERSIQATRARLGRVERLQSARELAADTRRPLTESTVSREVGALSERLRAAFDRMSRDVAQLSHAADGLQAKIQAEFRPSAGL